MKPNYSLDFSLNNVNTYLWSISFATSDMERRRFQMGLVLGARDGGHALDCVEVLSV